MSRPHKLLVDQTGKAWLDSHMTRKHFEAIAAITSQISNEQTRKVQADNLADYFATMNPNFDRNKFLTACGL